MSASGTLRALAAAPNWFCSAVCSCCSDNTTFAYGANNLIILVDVSSPCPRVLGSVVGHRAGERVTAVAFCQHPSQPNWFASSGSDGAVKLWDKDTLTQTKSHNAHSVCCACFGVSTSVCA